MKKILITLLSVLTCLTLFGAPVAAEENEYKSWADIINEPNWYPGKYTIKNITKALSGLLEVPDNIKNQRKANKEFIEDIKETMDMARQNRKDAFELWYYEGGPVADLVDEVKSSYVAEGLVIGLDAAGILTWSRSLGDVISKLLD